MNADSNQRATTPAQAITFNVDPENIAVFNVYYVQNGQELFRKTKDAMTFSRVKNDSDSAPSWCAEYRLTQKETALLDASLPLHIQPRVLFIDGVAPKVPDFVVPVECIWNDEELIPDGDDA